MPIGPRGLKNDRNQLGTRPLKKKTRPWAALRCHAPVANSVEQGDAAVVGGVWQLPHPLGRVAARVPYQIAHGGERESRHAAAEQDA
jgi:hypothetical protein